MMLPLMFYAMPAVAAATHLMLFRHAYGHVSLMPPRRLQQRREPDAAAAAAAAVFAVAVYY